MSKPKILPQGTYDLDIVAVNVWSDIGRRMIVGDFHLRPFGQVRAPTCVLSLGYSPSPEKNDLTSRTLKTLALSMRDGTPETEQRGFVWREDFLSMGAFLRQFARQGNPFTVRADVEHRYDLQLRDGGRYLRNLTAETAREHVSRMNGDRPHRSFAKARVMPGSICPPTGEEPVLVGMEVMA